MEADPDTERHRLHTAVADLLAGIGRRKPTLLVLEDVHWADAPTLLLLRHLARAGSARILLLATFRDTAAEVPDALSETLADLRRYDTIRLGLEGLSGDDVAEFVRSAGGEDLDPRLRELAHAIRELTDGNAFLVCELWRALEETGELGSPESVREVVSQRLSRLAPGTSDLLELAATAGAEFELDMVRRAAGLGEPELLAALDEAVRSGMIEEVPSRGLACRFTHELVRRALYDRLSGPRRAELHLRVGEALERGSGRSARTIADLAHHFASAAPFGGTARAVEYNLLAARAATAALAFDEAAARLRTALALGIEGPEERLELSLELGHVSHRGGKSLDALAAFRAAAEIARDLDDAHGLARAATGYEEACWRPGMTDQGAVEILEEAAIVLGDEDSSLRVGLLGGLARALDFQGQHERGEIIRTNAVDMARRLEDKVGLAGVLVRSYWSRGTTSLEEIVPMLTEAGQLGEELGNTEIRAEAMSWRVPAFVALSDLDSARREVAALLETAEQTAQPFIIHVAEQYGSAIALCDGRLDEAEARARRSHEWSHLLTGRDPSGTYGIQMFSVQRERGRLAELAPVIRILAGDAAREGPWRPGLAALLAELGMESEARRELSRLVADGLDQLRESLWLASLAYLADASAALGDEEVAALVYPVLEPLAGANVMIGHLVSCYGAADRYLGMLATTLGEWERAEEHFERGMELNRRTGAVTWLAHTANEYARLLLRRPRRRSDPRRGAARRGVGAGRTNRHGGAARPGQGARLPRARGHRAPRRALSARGADPGTGGPGAQQPPGGDHAVDQRTHGRQPRAEHPPKDGLRQPHRGHVVRAPARACASVTLTSQHRGPRATIRHVPVYVIERNFAEQLDLTHEDVELIDEINADEGVRWLFSFLSADRRRTYCLYEAPSADAIMVAAKRANVPADVVVEVGAAAPELSGRLRDWADSVPSG